MLFAIKQRVCFGEILEKGVKSVDLVEAVEATQNLEYRGEVVHSCKAESRCFISARLLYKDVEDISFLGLFCADVTIHDTSSSGENTFIADTWIHRFTQMCLVAHNQRTRDVIPIYDARCVPKS